MKGLTIGQKVAALRKANRWTLSQVAKQTGISVSHLSAIERGKRETPSFDMMVKIAKVYGVCVCHFVDNDAAVTVATHHSSAETPPKVSLDPAVSSFLASEHASRYLAFAQTLAEHRSTADASTLLRIITDFLVDDKAHYTANSSS